MNLSKAKILLNKINRLYTSMSLDVHNVASIEKDLMRDYIKQLYDAFLVEEPPTPIVNRGNAAPKTIFVPPPVKKMPPIAPPPPPPPPIIEEIAPPIQETAPAPAAVRPEIKISPPPQIKPAYVLPTPIKTAPKVSFQVEHEELFAHEPTSKELSEKLGLTPIKDLNKAMGLNERIFTVNELFGADNTFYRNVMKDLNNLNSFEEAKAYLSINVANKYNWASKEKRNKAKNFIKIVKRRYI